MNRALARDVLLTLVVLNSALLLGQEQSEQQLGLKLVPGKKTMPVFVIDHIERPSEN